MIMTAPLDLSLTEPAEKPGGIRVSARSTTGEPSQALLELPLGEARQSLLAVHDVLARELPQRELAVYEAGGGSTSFLPPDLLRRAHVTVVDIDAVQLRNNDYAQAAILGDIQTHRFAPDSF